jgi:hypothetical protein
MPAQVSLSERRIFKARETVEVAAGESSITINFPQAVPSGKKALVKIEISAQLVDE